MKPATNQLTLEGIRMNKYRILNRTTRNWWEGEAESSEAACQLAGWPLAACWVRVFSPKGSGGWKIPDDLKTQKKE